MQGYNYIPIGVDGGLNKDTPPVDLPDNQFSTIHNLRMKEGRVVLAQGYAPLFSPPPAIPEHITGIIKQGTPELYLASASKIHRNTNGIWSDYSRTTGGDYNGGDWQSATLNQVQYYNNGNDILQVLKPADASFNDSVNIPTNFRAKIFRGFKNFLFAFNLTEAGLSIPNALRWSDPADPGQEPPSWDVADPTTQSGQTSLADTGGEIVDALALRDQLIIYKTDSVYSCQFIGGIFMFSFTKVVETDGLLSAGCATAFEGGHFAVGFEDIYVHDGIQMRSVAEQRVKSFFFKDLDQDYYKSVFTVTHPDESEIWICYPNDDSINGACNKALVWNWVSNCWSTRDLPNVAHIESMIVDPNIDDVWDAGVDSTWDAGGFHWDANSYSPANVTLVMASKEDGEIYQLTDSTEYAGVPFEWTLEKLSTPLGDPHSIKYVNGIVPNISGTGTVTIRVGYQYNPGDGIAWNPPTEYAIGKYRHYLRVSGRYISTRLSGSSADCSPEVRHYQLQLKQMGDK